MARPWRIQYNNAVYHIMPRGVAQGEVFSADEDYDKLPQKNLVGDNGIVEKVLDEVTKCFKVERTQLLKRKRRVP